MAMSATNNPSWTTNRSGETVIAFVSGMAVLIERRFVEIIALASRSPEQKKGVKIE
jgi:hypothetical protein